MKKIPSISNLLQLLDKPALLKWANKIGLEGTRLDEYQSKSKANGNSYHNQVEDMIKHNKEIEDPYLRQQYHLFFDSSEILESEKIVKGEHWQGRFDIKFKRNGVTYLCDFKSNAKRVYLENKLQLVAYSELEKVDAIGIISLPDFKYYPVQIKNRKPYVGILRALSHIYQCKLEI